MFGVWGGFGIVKEMAQEIGIDQKLYETALTGARVNFGALKQSRKMAISTGEPPSKVLQDLSTWSVLPALIGLDQLTMKYPEQSSIWEAKISLAKFAFRHGMIEEPSIEALRRSLLNREQ